jgi:hypothetical protein
MGSFNSLRRDQRPYANDERGGVKSREIQNKEAG